MRILAAEPPGAEKPPTLPPAAKTLWHGMISGHRILGHGLTDVAGGLRAGADLLCQCAIGGGMAPSNLACGSIDLVEERILLIEVELDA